MIIFCQEEAELEVNKKLLAKVFLLKDIWRTREPKVIYVLSSSSSSKMLQLCYHYHHLKVSGRTNRGFWRYLNKTANIWKRNSSEIFKLHNLCFLLLINSTLQSQRLFCDSFVFSLRVQIYDNFHLKIS